jgi:hypothetical protein
MRLIKLKFHTSGPGGGMGTMAYSAWNVGGCQCDLAGTMTGQLFENSLSNRFIAAGVGQIMALEADIMTAKFSYTFSYALS